MAQNLERVSPQEISFEQMEFQHRKTVRANRHRASSIQVFSQMLRIIFDAGENGILKTRVLSKTCQTTYAFDKRLDQLLKYGCVEFVKMQPMLRGRGCSLEHRVLKLTEAGISIMRDVEKGNTARLIEVSQ